MTQHLTIDDKYKLYVQALEAYLNALEKKWNAREQHDPALPRITRLCNAAWLRFQRRHNLFVNGDDHG
jgi:hypothetical protein